MGELIIFRDQAHLLYHLVEQGHWLQADINCQHPVTSMSGKKVYKFNQIEILFPVTFNLECSRCYC